jgi:ABC-type glycerol-3-phosphate transport system permease component
MAPATMAIIPARFACIVAQRHILEHFVSAGLKG